MSNDEIVLDVSKEVGGVEQERVQRDATEFSVRFSFFRFVVALRVACLPQLGERHLVIVSDNIAQLTRVTKLEVRLFCFRVVDLRLQQLWGNAFSEIPAGVLAMTQLTFLTVSRRR